MIELFLYVWLFRSPELNYSQIDQYTKDITEACERAGDGLLYKIRIDPENTTNVKITLIPCTTVNKKKQKQIEEIEKIKYRLDKLSEGL